MIIMADPKDFVKVSEAFGDQPCPLCGVVGGLVGEGMLSKKGEKIYTVTYCQGCETHFATNKPFNLTKKEDFIIIRPGEIPEGFNEIEPIMDQKMVLKLVKTLTTGNEQESMLQKLARAEREFGGKSILLGSEDKLEESEDTPQEPEKTTRRRFEL